MINGPESGHFPQEISDNFISEIPVDTPEYFVVSKISCDNCGYYDDADNFPDESSDNAPEIFASWGWDLKRDGHLYAGCMCPKCGNISSFDFDPDDKMGQLTHPTVILDDL